MKGEASFDPIILGIAPESAPSLIEGGAQSNCRWEVDFLPIPPGGSLGGRLCVTLGNALETPSDEPCVGDSRPGVRGPPVPPLVANRAGELGLREAGEDPAGGTFVDGEKATPPPLPLEGVVADAEGGEVTAA